MFWHPDINSAIEPLPVIIRREKLVDPARGNRTVPIKIYIPQDAPGRLPVIVWSHGLGGGADGATFLSRFIASHGYLVVHVQHAGTDTSLWEGKSGHPWDIMRGIKIPREAVLARFADVPFVLDQLLQLDFPPLDFARMGMSGHSFGAMTTQVMAGQLFPHNNEVLQSFREKRFSCGILYSPVPVNHLAVGHTPNELYAGIALPLLHMTGTVDESPIEKFGYLERLAVYAGAGNREQSLLVLKDGDHMVFTGSRGQLGENPHRKKQEEIIKIFALAYWDAHLKSDTSAQGWLAGTGARDYLAGRGEFTPRRE